MKRKWKGALIGGIVGLIIPWLYFVATILTCHDDCGFVLGVLLVYVIPSSIIFGLLLAVLVIIIAAIFRRANK